MTNTIEKQEISRNKQLKIINECWILIARALEFTDDFDKYEYQIKEEEKRHRKYTENTPFLTVPMAVKYFVVQDIISAIEYPPKMENAIFLRIASMYAYSIWKIHNKHLKSILTPEFIKNFIQVDYTTLMEDR